MEPEILNELALLDKYVKEFNGTGYDISYLSKKEAYHVIATFDRLREGLWAIDASLLEALIDVNKQLEEKYGTFREFRR
jgi:hypothetical protein